MQYNAIPCNTIQYNATPCNTVQYHGITCNTMQHNAIPCNKMQYHAIPCKTMQYHAKPYHTMLYHAISCNTMQYNAIPCNIMQYHAIPCIINNCWRSVSLPCGQYNGHFFCCHGVHQKAKNRGRKNWNSVLMWQRGGWGAKKLFGQCTKNTDYQKGVSLSDWQLKKVNDRTTRLLLAVLVLFVLAELPQVTGQLYFSWFLAVKMWATLHFLCWNNNITHQRMEIVQKGKKTIAVLILFR